VLALADDVVAVPIYGKAESLNLAAAAAVCLYASAHASRASGTGPASPAPAGRVPGEQ
jgi:TrmH family RNA methyltransferase